MVICVPLAEKFIIEKAFALVVVATLTLTLLFATGRVAFSLFATTLLFGALATASKLKLDFLMTPALAPDLKYYFTWLTIQVISRYPILLGFCLVVVILIPVLLVPAWRWDTVPEHLQLRHWPARILRASGLLASTAILTICLIPSGPFAQAFNKPMWATITDRSYVTAFMTSFSDIEARLPPPRPHVDRSIQWTINDPPVVPENRPDIVAVLEESTFDPHMLKICTLPQCDLDMFRSNPDTRAGGPLTVHSFGGGTWTAEFAMETGLADELFGNAGMYAPYSLAPRVEHTLPRALKAAGYRVIAIYSHSGEFLNARNAYAHYGFDTFYDGTDFGLGWDSTDADLFRVFHQIYSDEVEAHPDQPLFIFTLTLHQHGPHMTPLDQLPAPYNKELFPGTFRPKNLDVWLNLNLGNYLYRAALSNEMLASMRELLWSSGRPTVLMHFGDHQPSFDGAMHVLKKTVPKAAGKNDSRVTYYRLLSNFPMKPMKSFPTLDITYLGSTLLEAAGVPKDAFYQANSLLRDRCDGRYIFCDDEKLLDSYHDYLFYTLKDVREEN